MDINRLKECFVYLNKEYVEGEVYKVEEKINLTGKVKSATIYSTSFGMYDIFLNGEMIDDQLFKPGYTYYKKRLLYQVNDVTSFLKEENTLTMYIGQGWYCGRFFCENTVQNYGPLPSFAYILSVIYEDGREEEFSSRDGMDALVSEYIYGGEYDGEEVDYQRSDIGKTLGKLEKYLFPEGVILEETLTKVKKFVTLEIEEEKIVQGKLICDFGQNFAGIIEIDPSSLDKGTTIIIRHGEILNPDGTLYTNNLRKAKATIKYTKGESDKIYTPTFTYMGFRYIEVTGLNSARGIIKAYAIRTEMNRTGYFKCENSNIQALYSNVIWGQNSNYVEVPTDCPQRDERLGYTGDGQVFAKTGAYNYDTRNFFKNFFRDLNLGQDDNVDGNVPPYLPQVGPKQVGFLTMQGWGSAVSIIPNLMYNHFGDKNFFVSQYTAIKKYVDLEISKAGKKYLWMGISLGDWLSLRKGMAWQAMNNHAVSNSFFVNDLRILLKLLKILKMNEEYNYYYDIFLKVKRAYIKKFISKTGMIKKDYQGSYILALKYVLDDEDEIKKLVEKKFIENVEKYGLDTGFFATPFLLPLLCDLGRSDLAFDILFSKKCPGWLYQIEKGATTIWERWDALREDGSVNEDKSGKDNMVSFNHYSFGSVGEFYYEYILGIKPLEEGFKKVKIQPYFNTRIGDTSGSYESVNGKISVDIKYLSKEIKVKISTPVETLVVLNGESTIVEKGEYTFSVRRNNE